MKNIGAINPYFNPVKAGGLTNEEIAYLEAKGWKKHVVEEDVDEAPVVFAAPELPGGYTLFNAAIPKGTEVLYDPETDRAIIIDCGNGTCWRYLVR